MAKQSDDRGKKAGTIHRWASLMTGVEGFITISVRLDQAATDAATAPRPKRARSTRDSSGDVVL